MGMVFAGTEIVELGIQIEINGRDFYNVLVSKSKSPKAKEAFKYLAEAEEKHIAVFKDILDSVHKYEPKQAYPQEYFAYMNALASEHVFTKKDKGKEIAKNVKDDNQAIGLGIGFEKDSIIFYEGIKKIVSERDRNIIDKLIAEEQSHLRQLFDLKNSL